MLGNGYIIFRVIGRCSGFSFSSGYNKESYHTDTWVNEYRSGHKQTIETATRFLIGVNIHRTVISYLKERFLVIYSLAKVKTFCENRLCPHTVHIIKHIYVHKAKSIGKWQRLKV